MGFPPPTCSLVFLWRWPAIMPSRKLLFGLNIVICLLELLLRPPVCSREDRFSNYQMMMTNWFINSSQWSRSERIYFSVCFFNLSINPQSQSHPIFVSPSSCGCTDSSRWFEILFSCPLGPEASLFLNIFLSSVYFRMIL